MLVLFGLKEKKTNRGEISRYCPVCGRETQHTQEDRATHFTLYFIPVLPFGTKQVQRCNLCGHETKAPQ